MKHLCVSFVGLLLEMQKTKANKSLAHLYMQNNGVFPDYMSYNSDASRRTQYEHKITRGWGWNHLWFV